MSSISQVISKYLVESLDGQIKSLYESIVNVNYINKQ